MSPIRERLSSTLLRREMLPLLIGRALMGLAGFVGMRVLTAVMSPALYGRYALVVGFLGLCAALLVNPIAQAMSRFVHEAALSGEMRAFLRRGLGTTTSMAALGALFAPFFIHFYLQSETNAILIGILIALTLIGANLRDRQLGLFNTFRWRGRYVTLATIDAWTKTLAIALVITLLGPSLLSVLIGMALGTWALALAGLPWLLQLSRHHPPQDEKRPGFELESATRYALPLFGVNLLAWLVATSDRYMIAGMLGEEDLGRYVASWQVAQAIPSLLATVFFPMFTPILFQKMAAHPNEPLRLDKYALGISASTLLFGGMLLADLDSAFGILVSRETYRTGDEVVPFVLFGQLLYALHQVAEHEAYFQKRTGRLIFANGAAALVTLSLNWLLAPRLGIMGAAIAVTCTYAMLLGTTVWLYQPVIAKGTWARIGLLIIGAGVTILAFRIIVPSEWPAWLRAPFRWALFALSFAGIAFTILGRDFLKAGQDAVPASKMKPLSMVNE